MSSNSWAVVSNASASAESWTHHAASPRTNTITRTWRSACPLSRTRSHCAAGTPRPAAPPRRRPPPRLRSTGPAPDDVVEPLTRRELDGDDPDCRRVRRPDQLVVRQLDLGGGVRELPPRRLDAVAEPRRLHGARVTTAGSVQPRVPRDDQPAPARRGTRGSRRRRRPSTGPVARACPRRPARPRTGEAAAPGYGSIL